MLNSYKINFKNYINILLLSITLCGVVKSILISLYIYNMDCFRESISAKVMAFALITPIQHSINQVDNKNLFNSEHDIQLTESKNLLYIETFFAYESLASSNTKSEAVQTKLFSNTIEEPVPSPPTTIELVLKQQISRLPNDNNNNFQVSQRESINTLQSVNKSIDVYIYHSHSWESFFPLLNGSELPESNRSELNIIAIGAKLKMELEAEGIGAEHNDKDMSQELYNSGLNANNAYQVSRRFVAEVVASSENLTYAIDIHRDSLRKEETTITINGKSFAKLYFVVGEDTKKYKTNFELANELHHALESSYPGVSRGVITKNKTQGNGVYNQDLPEKSILLEVGGVDNNIEELNRTIEIFAKIFSEYIHAKKIKTRENEPIFGSTHFVQ
ncbi:stage II sporulation protein P [Cytobacillus firmus]|nr:stage II sporulation protein P [Cytobacillus firmus]